MSRVAGHPVVTLAADAGPQGSFGLEDKQRERRRGKGPWHGPECPNEDCGSTQTPVYDTGRDDDDRYLRARRCQNCGKQFVTCEEVVVVVAQPGSRALDTAKFSEVDVQNLMRRRDAKRRQHGWKPSRRSPMNARRKHISGSLWIRRSKP